MEMDAFRKTFREQADRQVKIRLALEKIASIEKFDVTEEELEAEYIKFAKRYDVDTDKIKTAVSKEDITRDIMVGKAVDLIHNEAVITEEVVEESSEESSEEHEHHHG
jgi:trigger factor